MSEPQPGEKQTRDHKRREKGTQHTHNPPILDIHLSKREERFHSHSNCLFILSGNPLPVASPCQLFEEEVTEQKRRKEKEGKSRKEEIY